MAKLLWVIRCLCGETWVMDAVTEKICTCGAKLVRNGKKCYAEINTDTYDVASKPYSEPVIYHQPFEETI